MNKPKKMDKPARKKSSKSKTKKGNAEVFVLPPDILQKLGINLGQFQKNQGCPQLSKDSEDVAKDLPSTTSYNNIPPEKSTEGKSESSIMETANLMKQSVFLSPTFIAISSNTGEVEVTNEIKTDVRKDTASTTRFSTTVSIEPTDEVTGTESLTLNSDIPNSCLDGININENDTKIGELQHTDNMSGNEGSGKSHSIDNSHKNKMKIMSEVNITLDKNCKESSTTYAKSDIVLDTGSSSPTENTRKNKLKIISQEIYKAPSVKKRKVTKSPEKSVLFPVTIDTIISKRNEHVLINDTGRETEGAATATYIINNEDVNTSNIIPVILNSDPITDTVEASETYGYNATNQQGPIEEITSTIIEHSPMVFVTNKLNDKIVSENNYDNYIFDADSLTENNNVQIEIIDESASNNLLQPISSQSVDENIEITFIPAVQNSNPLSSEKQIISEAVISEQVLLTQGSVAGSSSNKINGEENVSGYEDCVVIPKTQIKETNCLARKSDKLDKENEVAGIKDINQSNIPYDKVKEISELLKQCAKKSPLRSMPKEIKKQETTFKSENLHGVEKPGGQTKNKLNSPIFRKSDDLKTYQRHPKIVNKKKAKRPRMMSSNKKDLNIDTKFTIFDNAKEEFCLCEDFGMLFNHGDELSNHIHFWNRSNGCIDPTVVFSIYSEELINTETNYVENDVVEGDSIVIKNGLCWSNLATNGVSNDQNFNFDDIFKAMVTIGNKYKDEGGNAKEKAIEASNKEKNCTKNSENSNIREEIIACNEAEETKKSNKHRNIAINDVTRKSEKKISNFLGEDEDPNKISNPKNKLKYETISSPSRQSLVLSSNNSSDLEISLDHTNTDIEPNTSSVAQIIQTETKIPDSSDSLSKQNKIGNPRKIIQSETNIELNTEKNIADLKNSSPKATAKTSNPKISKSDGSAHKKESLERGSSMRRISKDTVKASPTNEILCRKSRRESSVAADKSLNSDSTILNKSLNTDNIVTDKSINSDNNTVMDTSLKSNNIVMDKSLKTANTISDKSNSDNIVSHKALNSDHTVLDKSLNADNTITDKYLNSDNIDLNKSLNSDDIVMDKSLNTDSTVTDKSLNTDNTVMDKSSNSDNTVTDKSLNSDSRTSVTKVQKCVQQEVVKESSEDKTTCGVCKQELVLTEWMSHIAKQHDYMAWKDDEDPLDLDEPSIAQAHLYNISKSIGGLICSKCGLKRKYAASFLKHIRQCDGVEAANVSIEVVDTSTKQVDEGEDTEKTTCGVCRQELPETEWMSHIAKQHDYMAWKDDEDSLDMDDPRLVQDHLHNISKSIGGLVCFKCGVKRKYPAVFLKHIKQCNGDEDTLSESNNSQLNVTADAEETLERQSTKRGKSKDREASPSNKILRRKRRRVSSVGSDKSTNSVRSPSAKKSIKCGVCRKIVSLTEWRDHISKRHCFIAWKEGQQFDFHDVQLIEDLNEKLTTENNLKCKCSENFNTAEDFISHVETCIKKEVVSNSAEDKTICGVCKQELLVTEWMSHIAKQHDYMAWKDDEDSLDMDDPRLLHEHLLSIGKSEGGLVCSKCGLVRKYPAAFLKHIRQCDGIEVAGNSSEITLEVSSSIQEQFYVCGVCGEEVEPVAWSTHIGRKHNYLAWKKNESPLNVKDRRSIRSHLESIMNEYGSLICSNCGKEHTSIRSYTKHTDTCFGESTTYDSEAEDDVTDDDDETYIPEGTLNEAGLITCGGCNKSMARKFWLNHIKEVHNYLAWMVGQRPLNLEDEDQLFAHLKRIVRETDELICRNCGMKRKQVKVFLRHIWNCTSVTGGRGDTAIVKCGACAASMDRSQWMDHMQSAHNYLAWEDGDFPLRLNDDQAINEHLYNIVRQCGELTCNKCGLKRKFSKPFHKHIKICRGEPLPKLKKELRRRREENLKKESMADETMDSIVSEANSTLDGSIADSSSQSDSTLNGGKMVVCAVCKTELRSKEWYDHLQKAHNYLAWEEGTPNVDVTDQEAVIKHLHGLTKRYGRLVCGRCGIKRKYAKAYVEHYCENDQSSMEDADGALECALCHKKFCYTQWKVHAMKEHYNIAWTVGEEPINIKNVYAVEKYLKEYKAKYNKLQCKKCGITRASYFGFYAHIIICGKTEEETEMYKDVCEKCNNKYLCIYKSQHKTWHKEQELIKERRIKYQEMKDKEEEEEDEEIPPNRRRKAAQKAQNVIENYKKNVEQSQHTCSKCDFFAGTPEELAKHKCLKRYKDFSDSEDSVKIAGSDSSSESDVDSDVSHVEEVNTTTTNTTSPKRKKPNPTVMTPRLPFNVYNPVNYLKSSAKEFIQYHYSTDILFPSWRDCKYEAVMNCDLDKYMPTMEQSCKVTGIDNNWTTYNKFEVRSTYKGYNLFVGGCIECISWVPSQRNKDGEFLTVVCHRGSDLPRINFDELATHPNMIQIWNFNNFEEQPKLVLGIAHDYGTVWSIEWCPSGVRDVLTNETVDGTPRLGLMAMACSNGSVYILSVPHPSVITKDDKYIFRLKPVAELRMSMIDRRTYQATAVCWSKQKGHSILAVGYGDGTTAMYDLDTSSPFLKKVEDDVTIVYPYHDERANSTCVTDVSMFASMDLTVPTGVVCSTSQTGSVAKAKSATLVGFLPSNGAVFTPHWPSVLLSADDLLMGHSNEMEWWGSGRRQGNVNCICDCVQCGHVAIFTPPYLRLCNPHPAYKDYVKPMKLLIRPKELSVEKENSKRKMKNDGLSIKIEPATYEDAVKEYGLEFKLMKNSDSRKQPIIVEPTHHGYPLAHVNSMAFCASPAHHRKLAIALHSGMLFVTLL